MSDHENVGTEVFDAELFYSLSRPSRAKLTEVWKRAQGDGETVWPQLIGSYVGHVEDVLWGQRERKLTSLVLEAAAARKERREDALAPPVMLSDEEMEGVLRGLEERGLVEQVTHEESVRPGDREVPEGDAVFCGVPVVVDELLPPGTITLVGNVDTDGIDDDPVDGES